MVPRLCKALIDAQTGQSLLSIFPSLLRASQNGGNSLSTQSLSSTTEMDRFVALHHLIGMTMKLLCMLLHHQKQWGLSLQLVGSSLQACLVYDSNVCELMHISMSSTSPLLDCLQVIDQSYIDPSSMPPYLNVFYKIGSHVGLYIRHMATARLWRLDLRAGRFTTSRSEYSTASTSSGMSC